MTEKVFRRWAGELRREYANHRRTPGKMLPVLAKLCQECGRAYERGDLSREELKSLGVLEASGQLWDGATGDIHIDAMVAYREKYGLQDRKKDGSRKAEEWKEFDRLNKTIEMAMMPERRQKQTGPTRMVFIEQQDLADRDARREWELCCRVVATAVGRVGCYLGDVKVKVRIKNDPDSSGLVKVSLEPNVIVINDGKRLARYAEKTGTRKRALVVVAALGGVIFGQKKLGYDSHSTVCVIQQKGMAVDMLGLFDPNLIGVQVALFDDLRQRINGLPGSSLPRFEDLTAEY